MCDFENDAIPMCSWSQDLNTDLQWKHVRGDNTVKNNNRLISTLERDHTYGKFCDV
jgi:hypothetical protein